MHGANQGAVLIRSIASRIRTGASRQEPQCRTAYWSLVSVQEELSIPESSRTAYGEMMKDLRTKTRLPGPPRRDQELYRGCVIRRTIPSWHQAYQARALWSIAWNRELNHKA